MSLVTFPAYDGRAAASTDAVDRPPVRRGRREPDPRPHRQVAYLNHDINAALATIAMLAAAAETDPGLSAETASRLAAVQGSLDRVRSLLRQQLNVADDVVDVLDVAEDVVGTAGLLPGARITTGGERAYVVVDASALWRCLVNLVDNALRAAGEGGNVEVRVVVQEDCARVEVHDDGPGFGAGPPGAAALGLRYVREFVRRYGGRLDIRTGRLGGACAAVELPLAPASSPRSAHGPCR